MEPDQALMIQLSLMDFGLMEAGGKISLVELRKQVLSASDIVGSPIWHYRIAGQEVRPSKTLVS